MTGVPGEAPRLETSRLFLRAQMLADFEDYATMWADPRVTGFIGGEPRPRDAAWRRFGQGSGLWPLIGHGAWSVTWRNGGGYLGTVVLANFERGMPELAGAPEAGWAFAAPAWGQGVASEAVSTMMAWADAALDVPEIRCIIDPGNAPSIRVAEKTGFIARGDICGSAGRSILFVRARRTVSD